MDFMVARFEAAPVHLHGLLARFDTADEVLEALVRSIGVMKILPIAVEVPHASSDVDRTCAT
jgi:hypothetical protein